MALTGNKGEWSEIYVLFKLLGEKEIHAGDGELNKLEICYPVLKVLRDEAQRKLEYSIDANVVAIHEDGEEFIKIGVSDFLKQSEVLFSQIRDTSGSSAFPIPSLDTFLQKIHCERLKASSQDKADIHVVLHDYHTGMTPNLGFSIKSDAGAAPSLLNASRATSFIYELEGSNIDDNAMNEINSIEGGRKIQNRVKAISDKKVKLKFTSMPNSTFENNLRMIDSNLPEIIAWMLTDCYINRDMDIKKAVERIREANPMQFNLTEGHDLYGYKIKSLMVCTALGMVPATRWDGKYDATGGYIVVKSDGDIVCFHIYDRNLLEDYLFCNTKFDTPDPERHDMGKVYKVDGRYYFNLVLQIRFR